MSKQTSAALLLVGNTGSGKTSLLGTLAEYVWLKHQKITRFATCDPGGYGDDVVALVKAGIIQVFRVYTRDPEGHLKLGLETLSLATRGYWPREIDPETGEVRPGVDMVAPVTQKFTMYCPAGHPVRRAASPQLLAPLACPTCKVQTSKENCSEIKAESVVTPGFESVGAYSFDGLTSMSEWALTDLAYRAGDNTLGGEKSAINTLVSGGLRYGGSNRAAVGFAQTRAHEWVMNALAIPGQVIPPTFTALELRATDDRTDLTIFGPKIAGNAKTAEVPQWFGNTLGTVIYPGDKGPEWRLYLREYRMPGESYPHLCKVRATPNILPEYLCDVKDGVAGEPFSEFSLGRFYELAGQSLSTAEERLAARLGEGARPAAATGTVGRAAPPIAKKAAEGAGTVQGSAGNATPSSTSAAAPTPAAAPAAAPAATVVPPPVARRATPGAVSRGKAKSAVGVPSPAATPAALEAPPPVVGGEAAAPTEEQSGAAKPEASAPSVAATPVAQEGAPPSEVPPPAPPVDLAEQARKAEIIKQGEADGLIKPKAAKPVGVVPPAQPQIQPAPAAVAPPTPPGPSAAAAAPAASASPAIARPAPAGRPSVPPPPAGARPAPRPVPQAVKKS